MTTTRKPLPPATGIARWIPVGTTSYPTELLEITPVNSNGERGEAQVYEVEVVAHGYNLHCVTRAAKGEFKCYHLRHFVSGKYTCDCDDAKNRPERRLGGCKHARGLSVALKAKF